MMFNYITLNQEGRAIRELEGKSENRALDCGQKAWIDGSGVPAFTPVTSL
jgi:hypothetical protein